jgi:hypothetical protein
MDDRVIWQHHYVRLPPANLKLSGFLRVGLAHESAVAHPTDPLTSKAPTQLGHIL